MNALLTLVPDPAHVPSGASRARAAAARDDSAVRERRLAARRAHPSSGGEQPFSEGERAAARDAHPVPVPTSAPAAVRAVEEDRPEPALAERGLEAGRARLGRVRLGLALGVLVRRARDAWARTGLRRSGHPGRPNRPLRAQPSPGEPRQLHPQASRHPRTSWGLAMRELRADERGAVTAEYAIVIMGAVI